MSEAREHFFLLMFAQASRQKLIGRVKLKREIDTSQLSIIFYYLLITSRCINSASILNLAIK